MQLLGDRTLEAVFKANGDVDEESTYTVSSDGRSMIRTQRSVDGGSIKTVYSRL
jgi:hypothetical protein